MENDFISAIMVYHERTRYYKISAYLPLGNKQQHFAENGAWGTNQFQHSE